MFLFVLRFRFSVCARFVVLISVTVPTVSFEHHPETDRRKSADNYVLEISAGGQCASAEEQNSERQCAADEHHPHHPLVSTAFVIDVVVVHILSYVIHDSYQLLLDHLS